MVPIPPGELSQPARDGLGKPPLDRPRRISRNNRVGRNVFGHDGAGCDHGAGADVAAGQYDGAVTDPDVVTYINVMRAAPFEELGVVALSRKICAGAIGKVRLSGA